jgi:hypothetical protein
MPADTKAPADAKGASGSAPSAPSEQYLLALRTQLEAHFSKQDEAIDRLRGIRLMEQAVILPEEYRFVDVEVRDPSLSEEINNVVATLSLNPPKCAVTPARPGETAQENATLREYWTLHTLMEAGRRIPGQITWKSVVDAVVGDGGGWTKLIYKPDLWQERFDMKLQDFQDDEGYGATDSRGRVKNKKLKSKYSKFDDATEDKKKDLGPPFAWLPVDVRSIYPVFSAGRLTEVMEITERPLHSALREHRMGRDRAGNICAEEVGFPISQSQSDKSANATVFMIEHWDEEWVTYLIIGNNFRGARTTQIVEQFRHGYGRVPYFFAPGFQPNFWTGRKVAWGIGNSKAWLIEYRSYLLTIHAQIAARDAVPPIIREIPIDAPARSETGEPKAERYGLREIITTRPGEKLMPMIFQTSPALKEELVTVSQMIDKLSTPRVSSQIGGGDLEGAGFALNQVLAEAKTAQDPLTSSIESMLVDITRFLWRLVRVKCGEKVWVRSSNGTDGWLGAGPTDLNDGVGVEWKLDPERATAKIIEARYWHERVEKGTASKDQAIEAMGDNSDEVRFGQSLDRMRAAQWFTNYQDQFVLGELGRGDLLAKAAKEAVNSGQLPGINAPAMPGMGPEQLGAPGGPPAMGSGNPMGGAMMPDQGALAQNPGGAPPLGPGNGSVPGIIPGMVMPGASAAPGANI